MPINTTDDDKIIQKRYMKATLLRSSDHSKLIYKDAQQAHTVEFRHEKGKGNKNNRDEQSSHVSGL